MNAPSPRLARTLKPWFFAALGALSLTGACSEDDATEATPTTYSLEIVGFEGQEGEEASPHCDGTLAVAVTISPSRQFTLRPPHACGSSGACGYLRAEGLTADDEVLAKNESVTTSLVLEVDPSRLPELKKVRVSLVRGSDGELVKNPDGAEVTSELEPSITLPTGCDDVGGGGAGGAGGQPSGGAGGQPSGGAPSGGAGGQGGANDVGGGAGGQGGVSNGGASGEGGAPLGGATN